MQTRPSGTPWLLTADPLQFPDPADALHRPNGLLAMGGDLAPARLEAAYQRGIFPWYERGQPLLWWSPNPRAVLRPERLHIGRTLRKRLKAKPFELRTDTAFAQVIAKCAAPRWVDGQAEYGTWITPAMQQAYCALHAQGIAHSVEAWHNGALVGGVYGVQVGPIFCGESMFSKINDASRIPLIWLTQQLAHIKGGLLDIQLMTPHLKRMGAEEITRPDYLEHVQTYRETEGLHWHSGDVDFPSFANEVRLV
jgi:leucyl/phenylalanyl-tRNA--protein transferase